MAAKTPIFLLGATGYIGGSVLYRLLTHPNASTFEITALVRSEQKAKLLEEKFGVKVVIGSYKNASLVERLAENAHVVFSLADSDDLQAVEAINRGLKKRHEKLGDLAVFIHTSGTGVLTEGTGTKGMAASDLIYDDTNFEQMASIKPTAVHRSVDLAVIGADEEGYARTYIVIPSVIYGVASNPLVDAGIQNPLSIMVPLVIHASLDRGRAGMVGKGAAIWPNVHVDDTADLFIALYDAIVKDGADNVNHGPHGYYFGENGEHSWYETARAIGEAMVEFKVADEPEPTAFTDDELKKYFGSVETGNYWGTNARARGSHSRALGWKPRYTKEDYLNCIKDEVKALLKPETAEDFASKNSRIQVLSSK